MSITRGGYAYTIIGNTSHYSDGYHEAVVMKRGLASSTWDVYLDGDLITTTGTFWTRSDAEACAIGALDIQKIVKEKV